MTRGWKADRSSSRESTPSPGTVFCGERGQVSVALDTRFRRLQSACAGTLLAERWTICTPEPLRCWQSGDTDSGPTAADPVARVLTVTCRCLLRRSQRAPSAQRRRARAQQGVRAPRTRQSEISDSPGCVAADTRAATPSASMRFTADGSSVNSAGDRFSSVATSWRIVAVAPRSRSPLTCMTLLFVGDRFTSTVTEQVCVCLPST
jgi:hypothetical protein